MDCNDCIAELDRCFDEALEYSPVVEEHLSACAACQRYSSELAEMDGLLFEMPFSAPEGIEDRVLAAIDVERARRNRPSVIGAMAACALISTVALNQLLPLQEIESRMWEFVSAWTPETDWFVSAPSYRDQFNTAWSGVLDRLNDLPWISGTLLWGSIAAAITMLFVLNGICAAQLRQAGRS